MTNVLPPARMASVATLTRYAAHGIDGAQWYRHGTAQIEFVAHANGWEADHLAGIMAATSPRCSVVRNIRMALHYCHHGDIRVIPMRGVRSAVNHFEKTGRLRGPKTSAFFANLRGNCEPVTLDVWMAYALKVEQSAFSRVATRERAAQRVAAAGRALGLRPCESQAAIWTGFRRFAGYNDSPFSVVSEFLTARANNWKIEGCSIHTHEGGSE